jgi:hypothetical protein
MGNVMNPGTEPPPLPPSFYMAVKGEQTGPFDWNTLAGKARDGSLTKDTLVWRQGMPVWTAAGAVAELEKLFAAIPPPLPK